MSNRKAATVRYRHRITTTIIIIWAIIIMAVGLVFTCAGIYGLAARETMVLSIMSIYALLCGIALLIFGSLVYIIGALSNDVYISRQTQEFAMRENADFHKYITTQIDDLQMTQDSIKKALATISANVRRDSEYGEDR